MYISYTYKMKKYIITFLSDNNNYTFKYRDCASLDLYIYMNGVQCPYGFINVDEQIIKPTTMKIPKHQATSSTDKNTSFIYSRLVNVHPV